MNCPKCGATTLRTVGTVSVDIVNVQCPKHGFQPVRVETVGPRRFDGETYEPAKDRKRLNTQYRAVFAAMSDGKTHTLYELAATTGYSEQSISARIRDFRKARNGGHEVIKRRVAGGLWEYTLIPYQP